MNKMLALIFEHKKEYTFIATSIIGGMIIINTLLILLVGGVPSVFAHTMYIPVLLTAFFYDTKKTLLVAVVAGLLIGPLMQLSILGVNSEPWLNSLYRIIYLMIIGSLVSVLFNHLQARLNLVYIQAERLDATLKSIGDGVVTTDDKGIITSLNNVAERILGMQEADVLNKHFDHIFVLIDETTNKPADNPVTAVLKTNERVSLDSNTMLVDKDGKSHFIEDSAMPIHDKMGALIGVVLVFRDISDKVELDRKLFLGKQRLSHVVKSSADIIFEVDCNMRFVSIYGKGLEKIDLPDAYFLNKTVIEVFGDDGKARHDYYQRALNGETVFYEWEYKRKNHTIYFESSISPIRDVNNNIIGASGIARDITDKKHKQKEITHISFHDFLTKLYNRRYFADALIQLDDPKYYPLGVMMIDFNGLKIINDAFGHDIGDKALTLTAQLLTKVKRENDVLARIGGDEFAMIMPNVDTAVMDQMKKTITDIMQTTTIRNINLSLALGYELKHHAEDAISDILKEAENQMYRRKLIEGISARNNSIKAILKTLTKKYTEERIHSERVSNFCELIGKALGLQDDDIKELSMAGMYHDIGKISLPDAILKKPGKLTKEEYGVVKEHTNNGYQILRAADGYSNVAQTILYHHEWYNGEGYPKGLKREAIPLYSRIISVADAFEAMTSNRPYKQALSHQDALKELEEGAGTQFDPDIVDVFINHVGNTLQE